MASTVPVVEAEAVAAREVSAIELSSLRERVQSGGAMLMAG